jgi:hypothetical protein
MALPINNAALDILMERVVGQESSLCGIRAGETSTPMD